MDVSRILREFEQGSALKELSKNNKLEEKVIKKVLIEKLGKEKYLKISRSNGGKAVAKKLEDPRYRLEYVTKMRRNVRRSLSKLMENPTFKDSWLKKARKGSKAGVFKIRERLEDQKFYQEWINKCKTGGTKTYKRKLGFHSYSPKFRKKWSLLGLKNTGRKLIGPNGERMYNYLEIVVASILDDLGLKYEYEKIIPVKNTNGFVSIDFTVKEIPNWIIEVTYWNKPEQKMKELKRKWSFIKNKYPRAKMIVITSNKYIKEYEKLSERNINVFTLIKFKEYLNSKLAG